jgi:PAS domain S-box-containing protein
VNTGMKTNTLLHTHVLSNVRWIPALVFIAIQAVTIFLWQGLEARERNHIAREIELVSESARNHIATQAVARMDFLNRMAARWEFRGGTPKEEWLADATAFLRNHDYYRMLAWMDASARVRWAAPESTTEAERKVNFALEKQQGAVLETAREKRSIAISQPVDFLEGGKGLLICRPVYKGTEFDGYILALINIQNLFDDILQGIVPGHGIAAFDNGHEVYKRSDDQRYREVWGQDAMINLDGAGLLIRVWPRSETLATAKSRLADAGLVTGTLLAVLSAMTIHLAQTARRHAARISKANLALGREAAERLKAEQALIEQTEILQSVVGSMGEAVVVVDEAGKLLLFNPSAQQMTGVSSAGLAMDQWVEAFGICYPDSQTLLPLDEQPLVKAIRGQSSDIQELSICKSEARQSLDISITSRPLRDASGAIRGGVAVFRDITERRRAEQLIRESRQELRDYIDHMSTINAKVALDGRLLLVNKIGVEASGMSSDELLKMNFLEGPWWSFDPEVQSRVSEAFGRAAAGETVHYAEKVFVFGKETTIDLSLVPVYNDRGEVDHLLSEARDISEQKRVEQALRESENRFRRIFEDTPIGMVIIDKVLQFVQVNEAFARMLGYDRAELVGRTFLDITHPEDIEIDKRLTMQVLEGETSDYQLEKRYITKDRRIIWTKLTAAAIHGEDGRMLYRMGMIESIDRRKRAEAEIKKLNEDLGQRAAELEDINKELEAFSYSVSHDLRAPLRHVDGFVQLLVNREAGRLDSTSSRYLYTISQAAERMGRLIDDLLAFSRMGRAEMRTGSVQVAQVVKEAKQELSPMTEGRRIVWQVGRLPVVEADHALLRLVVINLLSNAIKYTGPREEARIEIGAKDNGAGEVIIFVRDNGVGFDMQYAPKLFGVFQRLHRQDEFEGTGIGLATVRRIINRHGGRLWVEAALDRGACFYFTLRKLEGGGDGDKEDPAGRG